MQRLVATAVALCALSVTPFVAAERSAPRPAALAAAAGDARVIVKFKPGASSMRAHALAANAPAADAARTLADRAATLGSRHGLLLHAGAAVGERTQVVRADAALGLDARALAARLAADPDVEYAEPDRRVRRAAVPDDPRFATVAATSSQGGPAVGQWYLRAPAGEAVSAVNAVSAWDTTKGGSNVIVAVLDTGVRFDHPDLAGKLLPGYDFVSDSALGNDGDGRDADASDPGDWVTSAEAATPTFSGCEAANSSWHGTQTAGIVGATTNNGVGMAGAGWNVRVLPVRVLGKCFGLTSDIAAAMRWAAGLPVAGVPANPNPAKVINLSLGSPGACSITEQQAVDAVIAAGAVVVAAAGNSAGRATGSPANCNGVIGVAALRHAGSKVGFSDVGSQLSIAAPGGNCINVGVNEPCLYPILTTIDTGSQGPVGPSYTDSFDASVGTSFSSPLAAATAALMLSAKPSATATEVRSGMQSTARAFPQCGLPADPTTGPLQLCHAPDTRDQLQCYCTTSTCGAGMLDAGAAVRAMLGQRVQVAASPAAPAEQQVVTLSSAGSTVAAGRSVASRLWSVVEGCGTGAAFIGATDGTSATIRPTAPGRFVVRLTLVDNDGAVASADLAIVAAAAPPPPPPTTAGGGGPMGWAWLAGLALAVALLARAQHRR